jgi:hypothetical protein
MHSRQGGDRQLLVAQIHGFVGRINSKLASIDEEGPVKFFLDVNVQVRFEIAHSYITLRRLHLLS